MRHQAQKPDYFDDHRKDHNGRPVLFSAALVCTMLIWAALIAAVVTVI